MIKYVSGNVSLVVVAVAVVAVATVDSRSNGPGRPFWDSASCGRTYRKETSEKMHDPKMEPFWYA